MEMPEPINKLQQPDVPNGEGRGRIDELDQIREALTGLRYGEVSIIVQDGVIVQIVRTEKRRLRLPKN
jgi:hypothetical protein